MSDLILDTQTIISRDASAIPVGVTPPTTAINLIYTAATIADLRLLPIPPISGYSTEVLGYWAAGDCTLPPYVWNAASTRNDSFAIRPTSIAIANPGRWEMRSQPFYRPEWAGAYRDGFINDTTAIQNTINFASAVGKAVLFGAGSYVVTSVISLPSLAHLIAEHNYCTIKFNATAIGCFEAIQKNDITIDGIRFIGQAGTFAITTKNCSGITIQNCYATGCCLYYNNLPVDSYPLADINTITNNVRVINNTCTGGGNIGNIAAIELKYVRDAIISLNTVSNYAHGIFWWGGTAGDDGALANVRKALSISIVGNTVKDIGLGGIWGSMGQDITVGDNVVSNCGDVGIDVEGGINCQVTGNTVRNCINGNYTLFFNNRNVNFIGNTSSQIFNFPHFRVYLASQIGSNNYGIKVDGNTFSSLEFTNYGVADIASGSASGISFENNQFIDCRLDVSCINTGSIIIKNNRFLFYKTIGSFIAITANCGISFSQLIAEDNYIQIFQGGLSSIVGIGGTLNDFNNNQYVYLTNNKFFGCNKDADFVHASANTSRQMFLVAKDNIFQSELITVSRTTAGTAPQLVKINNIGINGVIIP